jgi:transposase
MHELVIVTLEKINITETVDKARTLLESEKNISPALKTMFEMLLMLVMLLAERFGLNSKNSSKPPSTDPNRTKKKKKSAANKKPGGQPGRVGVNLEPAPEPDVIIPIKLDKRRLPKEEYHEVGYESRQVIDIDITRIITEYRAQILEDSKGRRHVAEFPVGISRPIQYGQSIKAHSVYLSQFQLIPYERVADYFVNETKISISVGSLFNFNQEAYNLLEKFDALAKEKLISGLLINADETGINVNGKRIWLHNTSNEQWTYFYPHEKRGSEAMDEIEILPRFKGTLVHDHWKPYYKYQGCLHSLCNAHHIRELQWVIDNTTFTWAKQLQDLLLEINEAVKASDTNMVTSSIATDYRERYRKIIADGINEMLKVEVTINTEGKKKRGRKKKTKELNLLERLRDFENDVLRFMEVDYVPFTNNRGENDIRMTKVQQKISGCFRSIEGAKIFCRVRSYLLTCQKQGISPTDALKTLFSGTLPEVLLAD